MKKKLIVLATAILTLAAGVTASVGITGQSDSPIKKQAKPVPITMPARTAKHLPATMKVEDTSWTEVVPGQEWDFNFSEETLAALDDAAENYRYWYTAYEDADNGLKWYQFCAYADEAEACPLFYSTEDDDIIYIPETKGILFGLNGNDFINAGIYVDGTSRLCLYDPDTYMELNGLSPGMTVTVEYQPNSTSEAAGFQCVSGNAECISGTEMTTESTATVTYMITSGSRLRLCATTASGDTSFLVFISHMKVGTSADVYEIARQNVADYMATLNEYAGLKAELQAAYDAAALGEDATSDEYTAAANALNAAMSDIKEAVETIGLLRAFIEDAEALLEAQADEELAAQLAEVKALDVTTANSATIKTAYEQLKPVLQKYKAGTIAMSDWDFDTNNAVTVDGLRYYLDTTNGLAEFAGFNSENVNLEKLEIPSVISYGENTYVVVAIADQKARYFQSYIKSVQLPQTLRYIGSYAFCRFINITEMDIPSSVTDMDAYPFYATSNLKDITLHTSTPPACSSNLFDDTDKRLHVPNEAFHTYRLDSKWNGLVIVAHNPIAVTVEVADAGELGRQVLNEAGYLQEVNKLTVSGQLNSEDWKTLQSMTNLVEIDLSGILNTTIPSYEFRNRWAIESVTLPGKLASIGSCVFDGAGVKVIDIPATVTDIGTYAFRGAKLESLHIPSSVTSIGDCAFYQIPTLTELTLSEGLTSLGESAFSGCAISELTLPSSLTTIPSSAFESCGKLAKVTFPEGLKTISSSAFSACTAIESLSFPSTLTSIGSSAFIGCTKLNKVELNEGLSSIEAGSFGRCTSLTEVVLPSSLRYCTGTPFSGCSAIKTITTRAVLPPTTSGSCPIGTSYLNSVTLYVPTWSLQEYLVADGWSKFLTVEATDYMPQNVVINKNFVFALRDTLAADYRPNIQMLWSSNRSTDSYGNAYYERGNLTVNSRSKLPVNNFSFYVSPYAKYYSDTNTAYGLDNENYITQYNPTALIVNGEMRAENVKLNLMCCSSVWQFVCFPFDVNMSDIVPTDSNTQWVMREYSGYNRANGKLDSTWVNLTKADMLKAGKGYILHCYNSTASSNGTPVSFTVLPVKESVNRQAVFIADSREVVLEENLSEFEQNRSWNLIGNPYPSFYDTRFLTFDAPITVWNSSNQSYTAYSPVDDSYILSPGEAFFVQRPVDREAITFANTGRQNHRYARLLEESEAKPQRAASTQQRTIFNITLSSGEQTDRTRVVLNEKASASYELNRDASKFMSTDLLMPQLYTTDGGVRYAINERPEGDGTVALGLHIGSAGTYTIALGEDTPGTVVLEDRLMGTLTTLTAANGYEFAAESGDIEGQFFLHLAANGSATGISTISSGQTEAGSPAYNLSGQRVDARTYKGLIIQNGHKSVNK